MSESAHESLVRRASAELCEGMIVNLGIGLPTSVTRYIPPGLAVCIHSENGLAGMGSAADSVSADRNLIDAGGNYVTVAPGSSYFDSAVSFSLVRGGRLDLSILGAFQVSASGDLANWTIPGKFTPGAGGAIELARKARRVVVLTTHVDKAGRPKLMRCCTLPLTASGCVDRIITDLAVLDVGPTGFELVELREGHTLQDVLNATDAPVAVRPGVVPTY